MADDTDNNEAFYEQLRLQQLYGERESGDGQDPYTFKDPSDGTEYEWDLEKKAWFPKITEDFLAMYHANYGVDTENKDESSPSVISSSKQATMSKDSPDAETPKEINKPLAEPAAPKAKGEKRKPDPGWFQIEDQRNTNVYVTGLPPDITNEEFAQIMSKCGIIMRDPVSEEYKVKLYKDREGNLKCDGLCCYLKRESVDLALKLLDEYEVRGYKLHIEIAKFQPKGDYDATKKKKNCKDYKKKLSVPQKQLDWRPEKKASELRKRFERVIIIKNMFHPRDFENQSEFDDVAIYFSKDEWYSLKEEEKELYKDVMMENYWNLMSLGCASVKPVIVHKIEQGEEPCILNPQQFKEEEIPVEISKDKQINRNTPDRYYVSLTSPKCAPEDTYITPTYLGVSHIPKTTESNSGNKSVVIMDNDYNTCEDGTVIAPLSTFREDTESDPVLVKHQTIYKTENMLKCSRCGQQFSCTSKFLAHQRIHTGEKPFACSDCGKCFNQTLDLITHQRIHTGEKPFVCSVCGKCFTSNSYLLKHQRTHTREKPFVCSDCGKCFTQSSDLITHRRTHTGEKPFVCSDCGKCFISNSNLNTHQRTHTGDKPFACPDCGKCFTSKSYLVIHQRIHTGEKPFACSECGKCFTSNSNLSTHQRFHTGEKPFACSDCGKSFTLKAELITHQRVHTGEKPFACSKCGKCFTTNSYLVKHQRIHTGERPFICCDCGKCFIQISALITHQRIHTGDKPFACAECGKCFIQNSDLITHQRIHTGDKPFVCSDCGKSFSSNSNLIKHRRIHSGDKPFTCPDCGKCFTRKSYFVVHQKIHVV